MEEAEEEEGARRRRPHFTGGVCLTVCVGFLLCLLGEVFLARRLRRRRRLLFHACSGEKEGKRMRNIAISIHIVCQSSLHWRYQRVS